MWQAAKNAFGTKIENLELSKTCGLQLLPAGSAFCEGTMDHITHLNIDKLRYVVHNVDVGVHCCDIRKVSEPAVWRHLLKMVRELELVVARVVWHLPPSLRISTRTSFIPGCTILLKRSAHCFHARIGLFIATVIKKHE